MTNKKSFDIFCIVIAVLIFLLAVLLCSGSSLGIQPTDKTAGYAELLFDAGRVHTMNIITDDWDDMVSDPDNEEYINCTAVIDGEECRNVGIRLKGHSSLSMTEEYDSTRFSFKMEFDHFEIGGNYHGLDKLSLNNLIMDTTMMKDFVCYQMMRDFGVPTPLCSYIYIQVNGHDWGLYLAVEGIEESFLTREFGSDYGNVYKPDDEKYADSENYRSVRRQTRLKYNGSDYEDYFVFFDSAKTEIVNADKERLVEAIRQLNDRENLEQVLDTEEIIRYFAVHNFVCNEDSYFGPESHNYYLYEKDGQLQMLPWDYNMSFGTYTESTASRQINKQIDSPGSTFTVDDYPMFRWVEYNYEYTQQYHQCIEEFLDRWFSDGQLARMITDTHDLIYPYVDADPTRFYRMDQFEEGVDTLQQFVALRAEAVTRQLAWDPNEVDCGNLQLKKMGTLITLEEMDREPTEEGTEDDNFQFWRMGMDEADDLAEAEIAAEQDADPSAALDLRSNSRAAVRMLLISCSAMVMVFGLLYAKVKRY